MGHENVMDGGSFSSALAGHLSMQSCLLICSHRTEGIAETSELFWKTKTKKYPQKGKKHFLNSTHEHPV